MLLKNYKNIVDTHFVCDCSENKIYMTFILFYRLFFIMRQFKQKENDLSYELFGINDYWQLAVDTNQHSLARTVSINPTKFLKLD